MPRESLNILDKINLHVGQATSWLSLLLVIVIVFDVVLRYSLGISYNWVLESEWHIFAALFLLSSGYTLLHDRHVRVDVFYSKWPHRSKIIVDVVGHVLLLLPWSILVIITGASYAANSWYIREGSDQPGGLPARYIIKACIVVGFALLLLQGISAIYCNIRKLLTSKS